MSRRSSPNTPRSDKEEVRGSSPILVCRKVVQQSRKVALPSLTRMPVMHVVHIRLRGGADRFDQDTYLAPSGEAFALEITNATFTAFGESLRATVAISPASAPAHAPVPGRPHMWTYDARKAIFLAPAVTSPDTRTV